ncbi:MAG: PspC domain-containing protein [Sphingobacteriaceae bacterium]
MEKKLYRDQSRKTIAGVCAGLADYFGVDVILIRLLFVLALILKGGGLLVYVILWIVTPPMRSIFIDPLVDCTVPPKSNSNDFHHIPAKKNNGALIGGIILIFFGGFLLLDEFDIIPDLDFDKLWPVILIAVGMGLLLKSNKKEPWEEWHKEKEGIKVEAEDETLPTNI